jgi:hypothetical protein
MGRIKNLWMHNKAGLLVGILTLLIALGIWVVLVKVLQEL